METVLHCDCGFEVRSDDEVELVARAQRHALEAHGMPLSRNDVLRLAVRAERGEATGQQPTREGA